MNPDVQTAQENYRKFAQELAKKGEEYVQALNEHKRSSGAEQFDALPLNTAPADSYAAKQKLRQSKEPFDEAREAFEEEAATLLRPIQDEAKRINQLLRETGIGVSVNVCRETGDIRIPDDQVAERAEDTKELLHIAKNTIGFDEERERYVVADSEQLQDTLSDYKSFEPTKFYENLAARLNNAKRTFENSNPDHRQLTERQENQQKRIANKLEAMATVATTIVQDAGHNVTFTPNVNGQCLELDFSRNPDHNAFDEIEAILEKHTIRDSGDGHTVKRYPSPVSLLKALDKEFPTESKVVAFNASQAEQETQLSPNTAESAGDNEKTRGMSPRGS